MFVEKVGGPSRPHDGVAVPGAAVIVQAGHRVCTDQDLPGAVDGSRGAEGGGSGP